MHGEAVRKPVANAVAQAMLHRSNVMLFPAPALNNPSKAIGTTDEPRSGGVDETLGPVGMLASGAVASESEGPPCDANAGATRAAERGAIPSPSSVAQRPLNHDLRGPAMTHVTSATRVPPIAPRRKKKDKKGHAREKRDGTYFASLPQIVAQSPQYAALSPHAAKLMLDLMGQYNGSNNGDLCAAWTVMQARGWRSRDTLAKKLKELRGSGFIVMTRQGGRHTASLYAITFYALDPNPKLDMLARDFPRGLWKERPPGAGNDAAFSVTR